MMTRKLIFMLGLMMATMGCMADDVTPDDFEEQVDLYPVYYEDESEPVDYVDPTSTLPQRPKMPKKAPTIYKSGLLLYLGNHSGYRIELIDETLGENGTVVYSDIIPASFTTWQLPSFAGVYTIRLIAGNWAYVGWLEL